MLMLETFNDIRHPVRAFTTWGALAAGFVFEEMNGLVDDPVDRDRIIDHNDGGRAKVCAERADAGIVHRRVEHLVIHDNK